MTEKKRRIVILIRDGILENVIAEQEYDLEVLKVDVDEHSEEETIFRVETVEVSPHMVEESFRAAEKFWKKEDEKDAEDS